MAQTCPGIGRILTDIVREEFCDTFGFREAPWMVLSQIDLELVRLTKQMRSNLPGDAKAKIDALLEQRHELLIQAEMRHLDDIATISEWGEGSTGQAA